MEKLVGYIKLPVYRADVYSSAHKVECTLGDVYDDDGDAWDDTRSGDGDTIEAAGQDLAGRFPDATFAKVSDETGGREALRILMLAAAGLPQGAQIKSVQDNDGWRFEFKGKTYRVTVTETV